MKAVIISHENGGSYVMDNTGAFRFVRGYTSLPVGQEIELKPRRAVIYNPRFAAAAASFVMIVMLGVFAGLWFAESHSIYVCVNPSVQLRFNWFDRLISARPLNDGGAQLIEDLAPRGSSGDVVAGMLTAQSYYDAGYMYAVLLSFTSSRGRSTAQHKQSVAAALERYGLQDLDIIKVCGNDRRETAAQLEVSPGRLMLAEQMRANGHEAQLNELLDMPLEYLVQAIR